MTAYTRLEHTPTLENSEGMSEFFGSAVASEEDVLAVGAPSASDGTEFIDGSVFLYHKQGGQWVAGEQLSPKEHQQSVNQSFGTALAFSGDVLYVGAPNAGDPLTGRLAGLIYVYQNTPGGWEEIGHQATRLAAGAGPGWLKVFSAAVIFERGPEGWGDTASSFRYQYQGQEWHSLETVTATGIHSMLEGQAIAIQGETVLLGLRLFPLGGLAGPQQPDAGAAGAVLPLDWPE